MIAKLITIVNNLLKILLNAMIYKCSEEEPYPSSLSHREQMNIERKTWGEQPVNLQANSPPMVEQAFIYQQTNV